MLLLNKACLFVDTEFVIINFLCGRLVFVFERIEDKELCLGIYWLCSYRVFKLL